MSEDIIMKLENRIAELEEEVSSREEDISIFKKKLEETNKRLEVLIEALNKELNITKSLQQLLMPMEHPNIPGFDFSSKFIAGSQQGGDYFDIFELIDKARFGMVVASCSGYSVSALLLTVLLRLTGQMQARRGAEPHNVLKLVIKELQDKIKENESADLFYSVFNRKNFELSYCRVGDITGILQDYSSGEIKLLGASGERVHQSNNLYLESESFILNPRDRIIFCTPGVIEATNLDGEPFGVERLYKTILSSPQRGAHDLRNEIHYRVEKFTGGQTVKRDRTVVVAEVKDRVIKLAKFKND